MWEGPIDNLQTQDFYVQVQRAPLPCEPANGWQSTVGFDSADCAAYAVASMKPMELRGRWVLVTGASSGLGREMARLLVRAHGAHLLVVARRQDRLDELKAELEQQPGVKVETCSADLSKLEDVDRVIQVATAGRELYAAVLNAGVTHFGPYAELDWQAFRSMLDTNVIANVRMATALIPHLEQHGGGLMIVSSMAGLHPVPFQTHYSGTKGFLINFGLALWHELQGRNVSVTSYAPSGVVSEMTSGDRFVPLRRWLLPVEQAAREGVDAMRNRSYLHISGLSNRIGSVFARMLPHRFATGLVAAQYRAALKKHAR